MTTDLLALADWLQEKGCTHVAMESTGVYWRPVYNVLEGQCELLVVNAQHIKAVPGRKTDVKDAAWIAEWLCRKVGFWRENPKIGSRKINGLRVSTFLFSVVCDRAVTPTSCSIPLDIA